MVQLRCSTAVVLPWLPGGAAPLFSRPMPPAAPITLLCCRLLHRRARSRRAPLWCPSARSSSTTWMRCGPCPARSFGAFVLLCLARARVPAAQVQHSFAPPPGPVQAEAGALVCSIPAHPLLPMFRASPMLPPAPPQVCEYLVKKIPVPVRDFTSPPQVQRGGGDAARPCRVLRPSAGAGGHATRPARAALASSAPFQILLMPGCDAFLPRRPRR